MYRAVRGLLQLERGWLSAGYATSNTPSDYALVMKKASEIGNVPKAPEKEVGLVSGVPSQVYERTVRIYVPSRSACQQAFGKTRHPSTHAPVWKIGFGTTGKWINPLMGWTATADPLENVARASLFFYSKEEAVRFCNKHGWAYTVDEPNPRRTTRQKRFLGYGDNFSIKRRGVPDLTHLPSNQGSAPATPAK